MDNAPVIRQAWLHFSPFFMEHGKNDDSPEGLVGHSILTSGVKPLGEFFNTFCFCFREKLDVLCAISDDFIERG
jgi:hypothetical protein